MFTMKTVALSVALLLTAVVSTSVSAGGSYNVADNNDRFTHSGGSGLQGLNIQQSGFTKVSHSTSEKTITTENESNKGTMKNQRGDTETTQERSRKGKKNKQNEETEVKQRGGDRRKNGDDNGRRKGDKGHTETVIERVREGGRRKDKDRSGSKGGSSEGQRNRGNGGRKADKGNAETVVERVRGGGRSQNRNRNEWRTFTCRRGQRELVFEDLTENEKLEYEMTSSAESFSFSFCRNKNGKNCLEIVLSSSGESTMKFNGEDLCLPIGSFYEKEKRFSFTIIYTRYCLVVRNVLSGVELAASVESDELSGFNYCYATSNGGGDSSLQIKELEFSGTEISTFIGRYRGKGRGGGRGQVEVGNTDASNGRGSGRRGKKGGKGSDESSESNENGGKGGGQVGNADVAYGRQRGGRGKKGKDSSGSSESKENSGKGGGQVEVGNAEAAYGRQRGGRGKKGKDSSDSSESKEKKGKGDSDSSSGSRENNGKGNSDSSSGSKENNGKGGGKVEVGNAEVDFGRQRGGRGKKGKGSSESSSKSREKSGRRGWRTFQCRRGEREQVLRGLSENGDLEFEFGSTDSESIRIEFTRSKNAFDDSIVIVLSSSGESSIRLGGQDLCEPMLGSFYTLGLEFSFSIRYASGRLVVSNDNIEGAEMVAVIDEDVLVGYRFCYATVNGGSDVTTSLNVKQIEFSSDFLSEFVSRYGSRVRERVRGNLGRNVGDAEVEAERTRGRKRGKGNSKGSSGSSSESKDRSGKRGNRNRNGGDSEVENDSDGGRRRGNGRGRESRRKEVGYTETASRRNRYKDRRQWGSRRGGSWRSRRGKFYRWRTLSGKERSHALHLDEQQLAMSMYVRSRAARFDLEFCMAPNGKDCLTAYMSTQDDSRAYVDYKGTKVAESTKGAFIRLARRTKLNVLISSHRLSIVNGHGDQLSVELPEGSSVEDIYMSTPDGKWTKVKIRLRRMGKKLTSSGGPLTRSTAFEDIGSKRTSLSCGIRTVATFVRFYFCFDRSNCYIADLSTQPTETSQITYQGDLVSDEVPGIFIIPNKDKEFEIFFDVNGGYLKIWNTNPDGERQLIADIPKGRRFESVSASTDDGDFTELQMIEIEASREISSETSLERTTVAEQLTFPATLQFSFNLEADLLYLILSRSDGSSYTIKMSTKPTDSSVIITGSDEILAKSPSEPFLLWGNDIPIQNNLIVTVEKTNVVVSNMATDLTMTAAISEAHLYNHIDIRTEGGGIQDFSEEEVEEPPATESPAEETEAPATEPPPAETEAPATEPPAEETDAPATEPPAEETEAPPTQPPAEETEAPATEPPPAETEASPTQPPAGETEAPEPDEGTRGDSPVVELPRNRGNRIIQEGNDQSTQGSSLKPSQVPPVIETIQNTGSTDESDVKETVVPEVAEPAVKPFNEEPDESGIIQTQPSGDAQFFDQSLDIDRLLQLQFDFSVTIPKGFSILLTQEQFLHGDYYSIGITEGNEFMVMRCNTETNQCDSLYAGPIEQIGEVLGAYIFTLKIQKTFDDKDDHDGAYSYKFTLLYGGAVVGQEVVVEYPDTFYIRYIGCTSEGYLATWKIFSIVSPGTTQRSSSIILRDIDDSCSLEVDVFDRELVFSVEAEELLYIHLYTSNGMYILRVGDNSNEYVTGSLGEATSPGDASRRVQEGVLSLSGKQYYLSWRNSRIKFGESAEDSEAMLDWVIGEEISVSKLEFVAKVDSVYLIHTYKYFYLYANVLQWTHDRIRATSLTFFRLRYERGAPFVDLKIKASGTVLIALATDQAHPESSMSLIHMSSRKISLSECLGCEAISSVTIREDQPALLDPSLFLEYQIIFEDGILKIFSTTQEAALFTYDGIQQGTLFFYDGFGGTIGSYYHIRLNQGTIYRAEHCHDISTYLDGGLKLLNIQHSDQMIAFFDEEVNLEAELAMEDTRTELRTSRGGNAIDMTTNPSCIYHDPSTLVWLSFTDGAIQYGTYDKENHQRSDPCMTFNLHEGHKVKYISFGRQRPEWSLRHHSIERKVVYKQLITRVKSSVLVKGPPIRVNGPLKRVNGPPVRVNGL